MNLVWATRGRSWGFRFLVDGGFEDPLSTYDLAFSGIEGEPTAYRRVGGLVALRFPDPAGRHDRAGRVIPHDIVVLPPSAADVRSVDDGLRLVWPRLAEAYDRVWDRAQPPSRADVRLALDHVAGAGSDDES
ncbi:hypothetical protein L603_001600000260 [Cellulosimicrobium cellulans J34]|nr:hypothetical protein L603_001600000260 [Cellulosimicrobium cellulans J34]SMF05068.1 hypothetical protein SAMN02744115_01115 [Cellulosimicrobium cellulans J1]